MSFKYKMSVIIPVYNCEAYLNSCIDSLFKQTMNKDDFQIVFVNDGSPDNSGKVCQKAAERYQNITYFDKENGGVSSARNKGLDLAEGKYIMFLDADDTLSNSSLQAIYNFFEKHYDETDLVTYAIDYISEGGNVTTHKRFDVLSHTGVYDVNSNYNILQTTMNVCVKNVPKEERVYFDERLSLGEDQTFNFTWIMKKQTIGFVKDAVYKYFRHSGSASSIYNNPYYCFDQYVGFLQRLLDYSRDENGKAHPIAQALVVYNFGWRLTSDRLVSHANEELEKKQLSILSDILKDIDPYIICNSIYIDPYHIEFFMRLKNEQFEYAINSSHLSVSCQNVLWYSQPHAITFNTLRIYNGVLYVSGFFRNSFMNYSEVKLYYTDCTNQKHEVELQSTTFCHYKTENMSPNRFGGFDIEIKISDNDCINFYVEIDGLTIAPVSQFGFKCAINAAKSEAVNGGYIIKYESKSKSFFFKKAHSKKLAATKKIADKVVFKQNKNAYVYRELSDIFSPKEEVWLYCDRENIFDNAYYQFLHDFDKKDGVKRYYIVDKLKNKSKYFNAKQRKYLVDFKSFKHKMLFLSCKKILTSFNSISIFSPFDGMPLKWYSDITNYEVIYLQHGILHANLPMLYSKEKANVDKVVVSSQFERENFRKIYRFKDSDLILSGMPRFDMIDTQKKAERRILFSPSWRMNLIGEYINNTRQLNVEKFLKSDFYIQINDFLNSEKLADLLEKNDLYLDFKNHPIFSGYDKYFDVKNPRVRVTQDKNDMQDYLMMITDYSSIVFDFVYLNRPIMYFVPDYEMFKAGVTHSYSKLDLPLEEAFGPLTRTADELLEELKKIIENGFASQEPYKSRMEGFFLYTDNNCRERIYKALTE